MTGLPLRLRQKRIPNIGLGPAPKGSFSSSLKATSG
jgi:hypothetical protein